jgi:hypothetical protein
VGPGIPYVEATKRPAFEGGTLSLTAAFFATTLLASRLDNNVTVYIFVSSSVVLFALYPAARNQVAINTRRAKRWGETYVKICDCVVLNVCNGMTHSLRHLSSPRSTTGSIFPLGWSYLSPFVNH